MNYEPGGADLLCCPLCFTNDDEDDEEEEDDDEDEVEGGVEKERAEEGELGNDGVKVIGVVG
eukprot:CAMPEP_0114353916 /NCGR_PEP_ID=MMETSP0101-20121206/19025_1 /TAXON_ID=38822 ORGANISM="Pteridomonas danica, Strain PT" /NCGR_SAMPLE_ID=MMETSP0101 /ASSEMBLY_ACC=CAM_ASM_000211 /LENGTH=61 /DNA_ID=CAMNT_0001494997 /DNA_START=178 /DNA_END=364 /DNA_ORIENTATION=+